MDEVDWFVENARADGLAEAANIVRQRVLTVAPESGAAQALREAAERLEEMAAFVRPRRP